MVHHDLVETVRAELARHADPERASGQQRYMKSAIPYRGLTSPQLTAVLRPILADPGFRMAGREEWDAAIALARYRAYRPWLDSESMRLWRHLVETGAWWDVVDEVATHLVREVLEHAPDVEGLRLREWAVDEHLWLRRTAIIGQVGRKERLDQDLLTDAIEPNLPDRDFFIRKAIGWALRDHARVAPDWVRAFVDAHAGELSGLSRREATRHLTQGATPAASPRPRGA